MILVLRSLIKSTLCSKLLAGRYLLLKYFEGGGGVVDKICAIIYDLWGKELKVAFMAQALNVNCNKEGGVNDQVIIA